MSALFYKLHYGLILYVYLAIFWTLEMVWDQYNEATCLLEMLLWMNTIIYIQNTIKHRNFLQVAKLSVQYELLQSAQSLLISNDDDYSIKLSMQN